MGFPWGCCAFFLPTMLGAIIGLVVGWTTGMGPGQPDLPNNSTMTWFADFNKTVETQEIINDVQEDNPMVLIVYGVVALLALALLGLVIVLCKRRHNRNGYESLGN